MKEQTAEHSDNYDILVAAQDDSDPEFDVDGAIDVYRETVAEVATCDSSRWQSKVDFKKETGRDLEGLKQLDSVKRAFPDGSQVGILRAVPQCEQEITRTIYERVIMREKSSGAEAITKNN